MPQIPFWLEGKMDYIRTLRVMVGWVGWVSNVVVMEREMYPFPIRVGREEGKGRRKRMIGRRGGRNWQANSVGAVFAA